jgi:Domain of unknown function (DUF4270)
LKIKPIIHWILVVAVLTITVSACKKDFDKVGAAIIPNINKLDVLFSDTASIYVHSNLVDSLRTDESVYNLLGSIMDNDFGRTDAGFSAQFRLVNVSPTIGDNPVLDSVILYLSYGGYYGDTNTMLNLRVYEISELLYKDSAYFSSREFQNFGFDYTDFSFQPHPKTPFYGDGDTSTSRLKINLDRFSNEIGEKILQADSIDLLDNTYFTDYFKGLYFEVDPVYSNGSVIYFDLLSSTTRLFIYYHDTTSKEIALSVNSNSARINHFNHDYLASSNSNFINQVIHEDTTLGDQSVFLQSMGGVTSKMYFPFMKSWMADKKILVNEAKLILPAQEIGQGYSNPPNLSLLQFTESGGLTFLLDAYEEGSFIGGSYDSTNSTYNFRITRHIQGLMMDSWGDYGLSLYIPSSASSAYATILNGPKSLDAVLPKMRLEIRYTEISK